MIVPRRKKTDTAIRPYIYELWWNRISIHLLNINHWVEQQLEHFEMSIESEWKVDVYFSRLMCVGVVDGMRMDKISSYYRCCFITV